MQIKPYLLDLYCSAGGCTKGYHRAGFRVVGVDINPQPRYCGDAFVRMGAIKALETLLCGEHITDGNGKQWRLSDFIAVHASPPCQAHSVLAKLHRSKDSNYDKRHKDLIPQTRELLRVIGKPYIIENVKGAPMRNSFTLCGAMFGLKVYRHRQFETSFFVLAPPHIAHHDNTPAVGRGMSRKGFISVTGVGGFGIPNGFEYACNAMDINWMSRPELSQAIPPAYTEWIGQHLMEAITC